MLYRTAYLGVPVQSSLRKWRVYKPIKGDIKPLCGVPVTKENLEKGSIGYKQIKKLKELFE